MREVESPDGTVWEAFVEWEGRRTLHRAFWKLRRKREERAQRRADNVAEELLGGCGDVGGALPDSIAVVLLAAALLLAVIVAGPWVLALLFGVVELGVILTLGLLGVLTRTLFRRPWRIVAINQHGELWAWRQVGWTRARHLLDDLADALARGVHPGDHESERHDEGTPSHISGDTVAGWLGGDEYRLVRLALGLGGFLAMAVVLVVRLI